MSAPTGPGTPYPQPYQQPTPEPAVPPAAAPPRKSWFARHKILTGIGVVATFAVIGSALGGGDDDAPTSPSTAATQEEPADEAAGDQDAGGEDTTDEEPTDEPAEEGAPGIGDAVSDGKFEFTVTELEAGVERIGDEYFGEEAQGQFLLVHLTVTNIGDEAQMFDGSSQELTDTAGRTHSADSSAAIYLDDSNSFLTDVNPGNTVDGVVVFDIPADAEPASIDLHDSMFSGGVTVSLG